MPMKDPDSLAWARELQAIAQTGLTFCRDPYDRERYEAIRQLAARIFAARTDAPFERVEALFAGETGYTKFAAQGGDWGAIITDVMATQGHPERWCHVWTPLADQGLFLALRGSWVRSCLRPFARAIGSAGLDVVR